MNSLTQAKDKKTQTFTAILYWEEEAVNTIRNDFAIPLGKIDYEILQTTYKEFQPDDPKRPEFLDLLHGLYALEYRNLGGRLGIIFRENLAVLQQKKGLPAPFNLVERLVLLEAVEPSP